MGVRLFDRTPRGVTLTEAGVTFLPTAHQIVTMTEEPRLYSAVERALPPNHHQTIGVVSPAAHGLMTAMLGFFHAAFPDTTVTIRSVQFSDVVLAQTLSRVDVLFTWAPFSFSGWEAHILQSR